MSPATHKQDQKKGPFKMAGKCWSFNRLRVVCISYPLIKIKEEPHTVSFSLKNLVNFH
jgi:hypothetical protein